MAGFFVMSGLYGQGNEKPGQTDEEQKHESVEERSFIGFSDKNDDGINDHFFDADGDGKNDRDQKEYPHKFIFTDSNKDQINDLWIDRDGDGVNDLGSKFTDRERRERHRNVIDVNEDGRNDITGEEYDLTNCKWKGEIWGYWDDGRGKLQGRFIDMNGDGIDDRVHDFDRFIEGHHGGEKRMDMFIDEDGDGICDDRTDFLNRMGKHGRKGRQKGNQGHGHKR